MEAHRISSISQTPSTSTILWPVTYDFGHSNNFTSFRVQTGLVMGTGSSRIHPQRRERSKLALRQLSQSHPAWPFRTKWNATVSFLLLSPKVCKHLLRTSRLQRQCPQVPPRLGSLDRRQHRLFGGREWISDPIQDRAGQSLPIVDSPLCGPAAWSQPGSTLSAELSPLPVSLVPTGVRKTSDLPCTRFRPVL